MADHQARIRRRTGRTRRTAARMRCRQRPRPPPRTSPTSRRMASGTPSGTPTARAYRPDWCTVREIEPQIKPSATQGIDSAIGVRRPLARLGMGLDRRHRQAQGDDIDIDAAIEARVEVHGRVGSRRGGLRRQPAPQARSGRAAAARHLGLRGRTGDRRTHGARATTRSGRRSDRRASRSRRPRGAVRLPLAGAVGGACSCRSSASTTTSTPW